MVNKKPRVRVRSHLVPKTLGRPTRKVIIENMAGTKPAMRGLTDLCLTVWLHVQIAEAGGILEAFTSHSFQYGEYGSERE